MSLREIARQPAAYWQWSFVLKDTQDPEATSNKAVYNLCMPAVEYWIQKHPADL
jgi:hypothetical protein